MHYPNKAFASIIRETTTKPGILNIPLTIYTFSILKDEHVPLKFLVTKYCVMTNHGYT